MQDPTTQGNETNAEHAPRYLDQWLESRDHANQWDVSVLMDVPKTRNDEAE